MCDPRADNNSGIHITFPYIGASVWLIAHELPRGLEKRNRYYVNRASVLQQGARRTGFYQSLTVSTTWWGCDKTPHWRPQRVQIYFIQQTWHTGHTERLWTRSIRLWGNRAHSPFFWQTFLFPGQCQPLPVYLPIGTAGQSPTPGGLASQTI